MARGIDPRLRLRLPRGKPRLSSSCRTCPRSRDTHRGIFLDPGIPTPRVQGRDLGPCCCDHAGEFGPVEAPMFLQTLCREAGKCVINVSSRRMPASPLAREGAEGRRLPFRRTPPVSSAGAADKLELRFRHTKNKPEEKVQEALLAFPPAVSPSHCVGIRSGRRQSGGRLSAAPLESRLLSQRGNAPRGGISPPERQRGSEGTARCLSRARQ